MSLSIYIFIFLQLGENDITKPIKFFFIWSESKLICSYKCRISQSSSCCSCCSNQLNGTSSSLSFVWLISIFNICPTYKKSIKLSLLSNFSIIIWNSFPDLPFKESFESVTSFWNAILNFFFILAILISISITAVAVATSLWNLTSQRTWRKLFELTRKYEHKNEWIVSYCSI